MLSATLYFRQDGTVSSVSIVEEQVFRNDHGGELRQPVERKGTLEELTPWLGDAYARFDTHNKTLEATIETERANAQAVSAELSVARDLLSAVARADSQYDATVKPLLQSVTQAAG